jgi:hypothetical protein
MDDRPHGKPISADHGPAAVAAEAEAGEAVLEHVQGLGATLMVTTTRVIVIRQGAHFRPRSGIREWPLSTLRDVQLAPPKHGNGRVVLRTGLYPWQAVSMFVSAQEWRAAERAVGQIRVRLARTRRSSGLPGGHPGRTLEPGASAVVDPIAGTGE